MGGVASGAAEGGDGCAGVEAGGRGWRGGCGGGGDGVWGLRGQLAGVGRGSGRRKIGWGIWIRRRMGKEKGEGEELTIR